MSFWKSATDVRSASSSLGSKTQRWKNSTASVAAAFLRAGPSTSTNGLLKKALSFQFMNKQLPDGLTLTREERTHIRMRYKDVSKHVIWPACPLPAEMKSAKMAAGPAPLSPLSEFGRGIENAEIEDPRTPFPAPAINAVLRSDSEASSDAEDVVHMTRL